MQSQLSQLQPRSHLQHNRLFYIALAAILGSGLLYLFNPWAAEPLAFSYNPQGEISLQHDTGSDAASDIRSDAGVDTMSLTATDSTSEYNLKSEADNGTSGHSPSLNPQLAALEAQLAELKSDSSNTELEQLITETDALIERTNAQLQVAGIDSAPESGKSESLETPQQLAQRQQLDQLQQRLARLNLPGRDIDPGPAERQKNSL